MPDDKKLDKDLAILDAVYEEAAVEAGENARKQPRSAERQAKVDTMLARAQAAVRATREQALADAQEAGDEVAKPIPARILAMARDAVIARLRELTQRHDAAALQPALQFRDHEQLSTEDLQRLLADLEEQLDDDPS